MKIAIVISNLGMGGAERWVANFSKLLIQKAWEVHLILLQDKVEQNLAEGICVHHLQSEKLSGSWLFKRNLTRLLKKKIKLLERDGDFKFLLSTLPYSDEVVLGLKREHVWFRIANTLSRELKNLPYKKAERRKKKYQKNYSQAKLFGNSKGIRDDMLNVIGVKNSVVEYLYNPIDVEMIREQAEGEMPKLPNSYIVHSARYMQQKRHDVMLDAWAILKKKEGTDVTEKLVCLTDQPSELLKEVKKRGLENSVVVLDFVSNPYPIYKHANLMVLSSEREGMPNVLLEAMACGTKVVSTNCPSGPSELFSSLGQACLAKVNDKDDLARAVLYGLQLNHQDFELVLEPFLPENVYAKFLEMVG